MEESGAAWQQLDGQASSSSSSLSEIQRQQQEQLAYYERLRQQRQQQQQQAPLQPPSRARAPSAVQALEQADAGVSVRAALPHFEERLLGEDDEVLLDDAGQQLVLLPDGRRVPARSLEAVRARCAAWVQAQFALEQHTKRGLFSMLCNLSFLIAVALVVVGIGARHLHDRFDTGEEAVTPAPDAPAARGSANLCDMLPIFLLMYGSVVLAMLACVTALLVLSALRSPRALQLLALPLLLLLLLLACLAFIAFFLGNVYLFTSDKDRCPTDLYAAAQFVVIATYVVGAMQLLLSCMRRCCHTSVLPV